MGIVKSHKGENIPKTEMEIEKEKHERASSHVVDVAPLWTRSDVFFLTMNKSYFLWGRGQEKAQAKAGSGLVSMELLSHWLEELESA